MALTNAQKQKRWREKRNALASAVAGTPDDVASAILSNLGVAKARKVVRLLDKRLRSIKPDCRACGGTGIIKGVQLLGPCNGDPESEALTVPCDCGEFAASLRPVEEVR